ncbi:MAG: hypothetical protein ACD_79C01302G0003 [uncultured bacterium]|nr:MAG: hypothetical protein ACD_79C01302G0003 [uncultured bacterium]
MKKTYYTRASCRFCKSLNIQNVLPLTPTALCDAYVPKCSGVKHEIYPLDLFLCNNCGYVFLPHVVDPEIIYRDYIYVTTSSMGLSEHFRNYSERVISYTKQRKNSLVVDLGSNDGTLLSYFKNNGFRVLGIEPAKEISRKANESGIDTIPDFFNYRIAEKIKSEYGAASIITVNNLLANIDDLDEIIKGVSFLLEQDGFFIIESSYLGSMIENMVFDFIYHEHLSYFSIKPLLMYLKKFNLNLINIDKVPTKGGSLRYYFQLSETGNRPSAAVDEMIKNENLLRLDDVQTYRLFADKIYKRKDELLRIIGMLTQENKSIYAYGASATSTTLIYHFELGDIIKTIFDDNIAKFDTASPGFKIPVLSSEMIYEKNPDCIIILAWRYAETIINKHQQFLENGGQFIIPLPELKIVKRGVVL